MKYIIPILCIIIVTLSITLSIKARNARENARVVMYIPADKQSEAMAKELELIKELGKASSGYSPSYYAEVAHEQVMSIYGVPEVQRKPE